MTVPVAEEKKPRKRKPRRPPARRSVYDLEDPEAVEIRALVAFKCEDCEQINEEALDEPLYECGSCSKIFPSSRSHTGEGCQCPDCYKFAGKLAEGCCIECEEGQVEKVRVFRVNGDYVLAEEVEGE